MSPFRFCLALLLALVLGARVVRAESVTERNEKFNFEISTPSNEDWEFKPLDESKNPNVKARLMTWYADTEPQATAQVELHVMPLSRTDMRFSYEKQIERWKESLEGFLGNPRDRVAGLVQIAGVEGYKVDVKGDYLAGIHQITYYVARNGKLQYLLYVTRNYDAVGDEWLEEEIQEIVTSFKFITIEKPEVDAKAKGDAVPDAGSGQGGPTPKEKEIDPELLAIKRYDLNFWRFKCVKPEGLLEMELSDTEKQQGIKLKFQNDKDFSRLMIRIWADTDKNARFTLEKLLETRIDEFKQYDNVKQMLDPEIDKRFDLPMKKDAIRLDMTGRSTMRLHRTWILADCRNERQYQLEIYLSGSNGEQVWGRAIEEFLKDFEPYKD